MRHAFGLPQVLLIILFIGGIVSVTMRFASLGAKHYSDSYMREQAELFLQSATEAALLRISSYDRNATQDCIQEINVTLPSLKDNSTLFNASITIHRYYLYNGLDNHEVNLTGCNRIASIETPESHGMIDMTVIIESNNTNPQILHPIRLERRSLQRP
jgi:hypothetical protein